MLPVGAGRLHERSAPVAMVAVSRSYTCLGDEEVYFAALAIFASPGGGCGSGGGGGGGGRLTDCRPRHLAPLHVGGRGEGMRPPRNHPPDDSLIALPSIRPSTQSVLLLDLISFPALLSLAWPAGQRGASLVIDGTSAAQHHTDAREGLS